MSLIELNNVSKIYRLGSQDIPALTGISLTFEVGEFAVLAGPSGSGKTTALNLIGGLDHPTSGQVIVNGLDLGTTGKRGLADFRLQNIGDKKYREHGSGIDAPGLNLGFWLSYVF